MREKKKKDMDLSGSPYDYRYGTRTCALEVSDAARHAQYMALSPPLYRSGKGFGYALESRDRRSTGSNMAMKQSDARRVGCSARRV